MNEIKRLQKIAGIIKESHDFNDDATVLSKDEVSQEDLSNLASELETTHFIKDVELTPTSVSCMTEDDEVFMIYQYDEDTDSWVGSYEGQKSPEGGGGACSPDEFLEAVEATADYRSEEDEYKRHKGIDENIYGNTAWDMANKIAQEQFGEFGFASLSEDQMAQIVNIQKANELAEEYYGEFGFATLSEDEMEAIFEKHPDILNTDIKY